MNGWTLDYVRSLDRDERDIIIEVIKKANPESSSDVEVM